MLFISVVSEQMEDFHRIEFSNSVSGPIGDTTKLLQPFVRGYQAGKITKGTGMGLAICKKIIDAHGGRLFIDASVEHRFTVIIEINNNFKKIKENPKT